MELKLGKMSGRELAEWMGISYDCTYRKSPKKYIKRLDDYCEYEIVRGGVIISEIYIGKYDKHLQINTDKAYIKATLDADCLASVSGIVEITELSRRALTRSRNKLFGAEPANINTESKGLLGYREEVWCVKLKGSNNYRMLTEEEDQLFESLISQTYSNLDAKKIKANALLLDYCAENNLSVAEYKVLMEEKGCDFFGSVIDKFRQLTQRQLARAQKHTLAYDFESDDIEQEKYRQMLLAYIDEIKGC